MKYCPECGAELEEGAKSCSSCGTRIDEFGAAKSGMPTGTKTRPTGVEKKIPIGIKVVCVLVAIFGLFSLAIGFSGLLEELSLLLILMGVAELITSWGLWTIKTWAWYAVMILFGISFIQNIIPPIDPSNIFSIVAFIIPILMYLYKQRNIYIG